MSISSQANRDFNKQIVEALNSHVKVTLKSDFPKHFYKGTLIGFEINSQSICLENATDERKNKFEKIFIKGEFWANFTIEGEPFPMKKLAKRLKKILPAQAIDITEDNELSLLGGKLIVTEDGVKGRGPTKDRVQKVFESFRAEQ